MVKVPKLCDISAGGSIYEGWYQYGEDGVQKKVYLHRLLAVSEWGLDAIAGSEIHHKNGIPWDNRVSNFEVVSRTEHMKEHAKEHGNDWSGDWRDEDTLREMYHGNGMSLPEIADRFGCSAPAILYWMKKFDIPRR